MKICLITEEFQSITGGGGIGACFAGLAISLASNNFEVEVLITKMDLSTSFIRAIASENREYSVNFLSEWRDEEILRNDLDDQISKSYRIFRYIQSNSFDVVHFHEYLGLGYYSAMARSQGLLKNTFIITQLHGSTNWVRTHNAGFPDISTLEVEAIERKQIELSDLVISPSKYMIDWYCENGVNLPESKVINWILPSWHNSDFSTAISTKPIAPGQIEQIIFFGRHERRKGFANFVNAIYLITNKIDCDVTFIGRFDWNDCENTVAYALNRLKNFPGKITFLSKFDQNKSHYYLKRQTQAITVMPSLIENSPCVVGEMLTMGLPFIAADVGGTHEILAPESRSIALVDPEPQALAKRLLDIAKNGLPTIHSAINPSLIKDQWIKLHHSLINNALAVKEDQHASPLVSIIVTHFERPNLLRRALKSLVNQTYRNIEIIVVDDGSRPLLFNDKIESIEREFSYWPVSIIRSENRYLGAARNLGASIAKGEYFLFHDDDNIAEPFEVEYFVRCALFSKKDILTSQYFVFHKSENPEQGKVEYYPIGIGGAFSLFQNRFGDANALISRAAFKKVGGFTELHGVGFEDWEFFAKAHFLGVTMGIVPIPLFRYFASGLGMLATGSPRSNNDRILSVADAVNIPLSRDLLSMIRSKDISQQVFDKQWYLYSFENETEILRSLMSLEPNSDEALSLLSKLAFSYGRFDDAIALALPNKYARQELSPLITTAAWQSAKRPRSTLRVVSTDVTEEAEKVFARATGWAVSAKGTVINISGAELNSTFLKPINYYSIPRPDVSEALGIRNDLPFGFDIFLMAEIQADPLKNYRQIDPDEMNDTFPDGLVLFSDNTDNNARLWIERFSIFVGRRICIKCLSELSQEFRVEINVGNSAEISAVMHNDLPLPISYMDNGIIEIEIENRNQDEVIIIDLVGTMIPSVHSVNIIYSL